MADLTVAASTFLAGPVDASSSVTDARNEILAQHVNGLLRFSDQVGSALGTGKALKGTQTDLGARLSRSLSVDGGIPSGTVFPISPVHRQPFILESGALPGSLFSFNASTAVWESAIVAAGAVSPFSALTNVANTFTATQTFKGIQTSVAARSDMSIGGFLYATNGIMIGSLTAVPGLRNLEWAEGASGNIKNVKEITLNSGLKLDQNNHITNATIPITSAIRENILSLNQVDVMDNAFSVTDIGLRKVAVGDIVMVSCHVTGTPVSEDSYALEIATYGNAEVIYYSSRRFTSSDWYMVTAGTLPVKFGLSVIFVITVAGSFSAYLKARNIPILAGNGRLKVVFFRGT